MTKIRTKDTKQFTFTYPPIKPLLQISPRGGGRSNDGSIIFRRSAGGSKRFLRGG